MNNYLFALASGIFALHLAPHRHRLWGQRIAAFAICVSFFGLLITWKVPQSSAQWVVHLGVCMAIAGLAGILGLLVLRAEPSERRGIKAAQWVPIGLVFAMVASRISLPMVGQVVSLSFDPALLSYDLYLTGQSPAFALANTMASHGALDFVLRFAYDSILLTIGIAIAVQASEHGKAGVMRLAISFGFATLIGYAGYYLVPACGPKFVVTSFPDPSGIASFVESGGSIQLASTCARNCVPSLHLTWAILCLASSMMCRNRGFQIWAGLNFVCTALATLGMGEHYVVDLLVALPFSLAAIASARPRLHARWLALTGAIVVAWIVVLRHGSVPMLWPLTIASVACGVGALLKIVLGAQGKPAKCEGGVFTPTVSVKDAGA